MKGDADSTLEIPAARHQPEVAPRYAYVLPLAGALLGGALPAAYGGWMLHVFYSQPPLGPGAGRCGMPALGAMAIIVIGTPIGAFAAAACGSALGLLVDWIRWIRGPA